MSDLDACRFKGLVVEQQELQLGDGCAGRDGGGVQQVVVRLPHHLRGITWEEGGRAERGMRLTMVGGRRAVAQRRQGEGDVARRQRMLEHHRDH